MTERLPWRDRANDMRLDSWPEHCEKEHRCREGHHVDRRARRASPTALVAGGETLINAFLAEGLVDELVFNVAPALESDGLRILLPKDRYEELKLLELRDLGGGIGQLRYALNKKAA